MGHHHNKSVRNHWGQKVVAALWQSAASTVHISVQRCWCKWILHLHGQCSLCIQSSFAMRGLPVALPTCAGYVRHQWAWKTLCMKKSPCLHSAEVCVRPWTNHPAARLAASTVAWERRSLTPGREGPQRTWPQRQRRCCCCCWCCRRVSWPHHSRQPDQRLWHRGELLEARVVEANSQMSR